MRLTIARSLTRRAATNPGAQPGIEAAIRVGGFDPGAIQPDDPQGYIERALSDAQAWNPAYLSTPELAAMIAADEAARGGLAF